LLLSYQKYGLGSGEKTYSGCCSIGQKSTKFRFWNTGFHYRFVLDQFWFISGLAWSDLVRTWLLFSSVATLCSRKDLFFSFSPKKNPNFGRLGSNMGLRICGLIRISLIQFCFYLIYLDWIIAAYDLIRFCLMALLSFIFGFYFFLIQYGTWKLAPYQCCTYVTAVAGSGKHQ
jgi:hypothetical protein